MDQERRGCGEKRAGGGVTDKTEKEKKTSSINGTKKKKTQPVFHPTKGPKGGTTWIGNPLWVKTRTEKEHETGETPE